MFTSTHGSSSVHLSVDSDMEAQFIGKRKQGRETFASMKKKQNKVAFFVQNREQD